LPPLQRFHVLRPMISSGLRAIPPSISRKMSAVIWGKSAVVRPASLASSSGGLRHPATKRRRARAHVRHSANRNRIVQPPASTRGLTTEGLALLRVVWQENFEWHGGGQDRNLKPLSIFRLPDAVSPARKRAAKSSAANSLHRSTRLRAFRGGGSSPAAIR